MIRLVSLVMGTLIATASVAMAGDYADRAILGFSPDGAYFAFEEFGVQDGSGFAYSNVYIIETATDRWVPGSPVRVTIQDESVPLSESRRDALDQAQDLLLASGIGVEGRFLISNPVTETSADPHVVSFILNRPPAPAGDTYVLQLTEKPLPSADCPDVGEPFKGLRLDLLTPQGTRTLADDTRLPASRNCPLGYGISDVVAYTPPGGGRTVAIVFVNVFSYGFEGPDRRFIAIAAHL